ncbi:MAG: MFS transporter [Chitinophagaceae bacterium]|nr:MAG: MFS transporter [Chitinophagaceae bacterium]
MEPQSSSLLSGETSLLSGQKSRSVFSLVVIVASLGYFVDIYDLVLFGIIRVSSLTSLGLSPDQIREKGLLLINVQMAGMLLGGILWGVLGDKKGRLKVLFGSIILYSIANIANGFVHGINGYMLWRFLAGLGLAGELGAGITLVAEVLPREKRGYGTMLIPTIGVSGAIVAGFIAEEFSWRTCFFIGGGLGILLLLLRIGVLESGMFNTIKNARVSKGNFFSLFTDKEKFIKYLKCILIGLPTWYVVGILVFFSNDFARQMGVHGVVKPAIAVMASYAGLVFGDLLSGIISQIWKSRKKTVILFLLLTAGTIILYFNLYNATPKAFYWICFALGVTVGYWAIFITIAAEQFGTNLRATVTTTVTNFVRGMLIPISALYAFLQNYVSLYVSGAVVGAACLIIALIAAFSIEETFHKDLNYVEK